MLALMATRDESRADAQLRSGAAAAGELGGVCGKNRKNLVIEVLRKIVA
jgi:hypothetical protein